MYCTASPLGAFESRLFRAVFAGTSGGNSSAGSLNDLPYNDVEVSCEGVSEDSANHKTYTLSPGTYYVEFQTNIYAVGHAYLVWSAGAQNGQGSQVFINPTSNDEIQYRYAFMLTVTAETTLTLQLYTESAATAGLGSGNTSGSVVRFTNIWRLY